MRKFEFSIIASGLDHTEENFEARFYDAGCDDALVSFQKGHIIIDFAREAKSFAEALASAVDCVRQAGATVEHIEPDPLVSLADIAARSGMTRAAMSQYSKRQRGRNFPNPVAKVTTESPLWDWAEVAWWLFRQEKVPKEVVVEAELVKTANKILSQDSDTERLLDFIARIRDTATELESADMAAIETAIDF